MRNDMYRALEYATKMLEIEWERSGGLKEAVELDITALENLQRKIQKEILERGKSLDKMGTLAYEEFVSLSHENYVLLRLCKKVIMAYNKALKSHSVFGKLFLDKEESKAYRDLVKVAEEA